jgi:hypothetical protein
MFILHAKGVYCFLKNSSHHYFVKQAVVGVGDASSKLGVFLSFSSISLVLVFTISPLQALLCVFCIFRCNFFGDFGLLFFLLFFPCWGVFPLFVY